MKQLLIALSLFVCLCVSSQADSFLLGGLTGGRFDSTSALARDPYIVRFGATPATVTVLTGLDINNPVGSILYNYAANNAGYFNLDPGQSTTLTFGQITRTLTGTPGPTSYNLPFQFLLAPLTLTLGPPNGNPTTWVTGQLQGINPNGRQPFWGGTLSTNGISSGGIYADSGDNVNVLLGTLSYAFPQEVIKVTFNASTWVNNTLTISATITRDAAAVPEPTTFLLLGSGLASLAAMRRKRRKLPTL